MLALAALLLTVGERLANGDFEAPPTPGAIAGWTLEFGARNGGTEPASVVEIDPSEKRSGDASLHLAGDDKVRGWRAARQEFEGRPGATYTLRASLKSKDVRSEKLAGVAVQQYSNAYVALFMRASDGQIVEKKYCRATLPSADWSDMSAVAVAPETTRSVEIYVFLSMSGHMWVDDVSLEVTGGRALPPEELVLIEGFDKQSGLPKGWYEVLGASNAVEGPRSKLEIDATTGEGDSPGSLHLAGDARTKKWFACRREFEAKPGDVFGLGASFKTLDVRKEDIQFQNLHLALAFLAADGRVLGSPVVAEGPRGTSDWKRAQARGIAPEGTARIELTAFLSMSGDVWIDRIELKRRGGGTPAYADWMTMDSTHVVLRYPKDHPQRSELRAYAKKLDDAYETVRRRLGVEFTDKITVYLYATHDQGRRFTGRPLAFAAPEDRTVHQTTSNTISHELTHVIALAVGYAQTPLFGEGIAVWLDGESDDLHHKQAAQLQRDGRLPSLATLLEKFREDETLTYPAAGSFVGYLLTLADMSHFKLLYVAADPVEAAPRIYGKPLAELDAAWREYLAKR